MVSDFRCVEGQTKVNRRNIRHRRASIDLPIETFGSSWFLGQNEIMCSYLLAGDGELGMKN
jgi:hypothetical protein